MILTLLTPCCIHTRNLRELKSVLLKDPNIRGLASDTGSSPSERKCVAGWRLGPSENQATLEQAWLVEACFIKYLVVCRHALASSFFGLGCPRPVCI